MVTFERKLTQRPLSSKKTFMHVIDLTLRHVRPMPRNINFISR